MKLKIIQEIYEDGIKEGMKQAKLIQKEQNSIETAKRMIKMGFSKEDILIISRISEENLKKLM
ncbi:MAG: hypothetical protein MJ224_07380 [archaeon]|nr:hypothetical protein [archaeon]